MWENGVGIGGKEAVCKIKFSKGLEEASEIKQKKKKKNVMSDHSVPENMYS